MGVIKVNDIPYAGGGSSNYTDLTNKPSINNVSLSGNKTAADLGVAAVANGQDLTFSVDNNGILCITY